MRSLKLLFVVDGRSPIALNWIRYFVEKKHEVHIASMYPCQPDLELASLTIIPVTFSRAVDTGGKGKNLQVCGEKSYAALQPRIFAPGSASVLYLLVCQKLLPNSKHS
jgi:hypothetical protein